MRFRVILACVAVATAGLAAAPAEAATPGPIPVTECGQVITRDAYLTRDLTCDTFFGISLVAPPDAEEGAPVSASLNLRGHRLRGSGTGIGILVDVYPALGNLRVKNGRVDHWDAGLHEASGEMRIKRLRIDHNDRGLWCNDRCIVKKSLIKRNRVGTWQAEANVTLVKNVIVGNEIGSELAGVTLGDFSKNLYARNEVGVSVTTGFASLTRNSFYRNGVGVTGPSDDFGSASLVRNWFVHNRDGVYLPSQEGSELRRNVALGNRRYGFFAPLAKDLGGNIGAGNGRPCVGVACAS
jgi:hypothetical protein